MLIRSETNSHTFTHTHTSASAAPLFIASTVRFAEQTSARELLFPTLLRGPTGRCASNIMPAGMMQSSALSLRGTDFRFHLWTLSERWRWLHTANLCGGRRGSGKKNYNCQLSAQTNKRAHKLARGNLKSWLSVCLCLFAYVCICVFLHLVNSHGCMCPLPFLQCKYVSHTNGQMKGLTPYLHACRDSYVTNTPLWLNERAEWYIR